MVAAFTAKVTTTAARRAAKDVITTARQPHFSY